MFLGGSVSVHGRGRDGPAGLCMGHVRWSSLQLLRGPQYFTMCGGHPGFLLGVRGLSAAPSVGGGAVVRRLVLFSAPDPQVDPCSSSAAASSSFTGAQSSPTLPVSPRAVCGEVLRLVEAELKEEYFTMWGELHSQFHNSPVLVNYKTTIAGTTAQWGGSRPRGQVSPRRGRVRSLPLFSSCCPSAAAPPSSSTRLRPLATNCLVPNKPYVEAPPRLCCVS